MTEAGYELITNDARLVEWCGELRDVPWIGFDTEFVSEHTYKPELCLLQVAVGERLTLVDTLAIDDMRPFWDILAGGDHETIVHAGRQEFLFCLESAGRAPKRWFDVQLAAGMIGLEYPAGYGNLLHRLLDLKAQKGETRTDWRRRPLSDKQLEYALDDVRHLHALRTKLGNKLKKLDRVAWFEEESAAWQEDLITSLGSERWRRVSGSSGLPSRSLAIVREIWNWREAQSERRNSPTRHVLRDDLIVEIAKRRSADPKQLSAVRGMERGDLKRALPELARLVQKALDLPNDELPEQIRGESNSHLTMLGQFLSSALGSICREANVAANLVGTASDVRDLIAYRTEGSRAARGKPPVLTQGWRAIVVGQVLDDLLAGKLAIRIRDPRDEQPLTFESTD